MALGGERGKKGPRKQKYVMQHDGDSLYRRENIEKKERTGEVIPEQMQVEGF